MTRIRKCGTWLAAWVVTTVLAFGQPPNEQSARGKATPPQIPASKALQPNTEMQAEVLREIDDPSSGNRWLLLRDPSDPGGPGKLVLETRIPGQPERRRNNPTTTISGVGSTTNLGSGAAATGLAVIHAGDRVIVEENTPVVEARLEAVALNPAKVGSIFKARLAIGGKVVRVRALGRGRATFAEEIGAQP